MQLDLLCVSAIGIDHLHMPRVLLARAREIVGFAGSGPIFETVNRFISRQVAENRSIKLCISQDFAIYSLTLIVTCQNCSHLIIHCYLA